MSPPGKVATATRYGGLRAISNCSVAESGLAHPAVSGKNPAKKVRKICKSGDFKSVYPFDMRRLDNSLNQITKHPGVVAIGLLLAVLLPSGCKPKPPGVAAPQSTGYFQTPYQDETTYIVETIASDVAEQMFYAASHRLPEPNSFAVTAEEKAGSAVDTPTYSVTIQLDQKTAPVKCDLTLNGPIWSPEDYAGLAGMLAQAVGLKAAPAAAGPPDAPLLAALADGTPETIEQENQILSGALEKDFANPELHEQAAALLGAFLLRDHSGNFFEIRSPLCRITAHQIMARFLRGSAAPGLNGQMAAAMTLTLAGDEAPAVGQLDAIGTNNPAAPLVRALLARNTGDFRALDQRDGLTRVESAGWFQARASYLSCPLAWSKLSEAQMQTIDFVRMAYEESYTVEIGHQLYTAAIPLELREISSIYELSHHEKLAPNALTAALNELPERCLSGSGSDVHVHIIGWGQWAAFLQRHLCHAVQKDFNFLNVEWGVPDDAREFAAKCDAAFGGLRLYPFVRRFDCTDVDSYHRSVDDGFKVTVATPELVPAECWNYLCYHPRFAPPYDPNPNPHINEWHNHNPPPGTVYDLHPRLDHPSLVGRGDAVDRFEKLHELAPYDCRIVTYLLVHKYADHPSYEVVTNLYQGVLPYSLVAMRTAANSVYDQPDLYEKLMLRAAALNPACYYDLSTFEQQRDNGDKAEQYLDQACDADLDSVEVANCAVQRVRYYLAKGQTDRARQIADFAGEVYSEQGLESKALFFEATSNYDGAFDYYSKIEERYEQSQPLIEFCLRYQRLTGDTRFAPELKKRLSKLFPHGMERASLPDYHDVPADGVLIAQDGDLIRQAGLRAGDVIVGLNGQRTHTFDQYKYVRDSLTGPEMDLIVWQGGGYHEYREAPPGHLFGVEFTDYKPQ
jgi:tetratricopeptide (TPR) repeat protein